ncbi:DEAD/DEAH box helicase [Profundibacter sp.]
MTHLLMPDTPVSHPRHGDGRVISDLGPTCIVRFNNRLEQVVTEELDTKRSVETALSEGWIDDPLSVITRAQALAIQSVNDQWGVFSRSRVQLLPHQLWVCRQVTKTWPARWLVADDVGLGKTIEAGLILTPLLASKRVKRLLILTPARLAPQWRARLKTMFDIRLQEYTAELDRGRTSFWDTADQVVASFHTLRGETARKRLLAAEPWDLVMVDEAHHFQAQEKDSTLTYQLLEELQDAGRIDSMVLFTGTPHRGKDHGFFALMKLVRPDLFDPRKPVSEQLPLLREAMIRNNKAHVTDLQGKKLFKPVTTTQIDFRYSPDEQTFYDTMSEFILDGRTYANSLSGRQQTARMLLLIALQKLTASSIAAIRAALEKRREMLLGIVNAQTSMKARHEPLTLDEAAEFEEGLSGELEALLLQDEIDRLEELVDLARHIGRETKIERLLDMLAADLPEGEPVLFFTEYKATQALVFAALEERFGEGCVGFINGEDRLLVPDLLGGKPRQLTLERETAADAFNEGKTRFLVSTEAGGEGIDLQERCAVLVHVDLPWNPMRLHQRVGRLSRYGQKRTVSVFLMRNPETVEARIWDLLQSKLGRIQSAISSVMDEDEDIAQLVIGMTPPGIFDQLYSEASHQSSERLGDWFDAQTATFGGRDAVDTVRKMLGNVARYDFQSVGAQLPKLDLPDLEPFFRNAMHVYSRRVTRNDKGLGVATPEIWRRDPDLKTRYDGLRLNRDGGSGQFVSEILGVGHALFDRALNETGCLEAHVARAKGLDTPLIVASIEDELTGTGATVHRVAIGAINGGNGIEILRDWELLLFLNQLEPDAGAEATEEEKSLINQVWQDLPKKLDKLGFEFTRPRAFRSLIILPL